MYMETVKKRPKICDSWYHQKWFRFILVLVGIDMIILGFSFIISFDIMTVISQMSIIFHIIFGFMYILVALFIIHFALDYEKLKKESHFVCYHCGYINNVKEKEGE